MGKFLLQIGIWKGYDEAGKKAGEDFVTDYILSGNLVLLDMQSTRPSFPRQNIPLLTITTIVIVCCTTNCGTSW